MSEDYPSTPAGQRSWLERLGHALSGEPRNRQELIEELRGAMDNGIVDAETLRMLEGAINVSELQVSDVMVPRAQMVSLPADAPFAEILKRVVESGHSRFPVHGEHLDQIQGVLLAKDLLRCWSSGGECRVRDLLRPIDLIPETKRLNVLLKEFKANRYHMAVVVDEYGGIAGLVTIEDVLEQIVGEIDDEHDAEDKVEATIVDQGDGAFTVQALTPIEEFNAHFGTEFSADEIDTVGGMVTQALGHLPARGESVELGGHAFEVLKADNRRLHQLRVRRLPPNA